MLEVQSVFHSGPFPTKRVVRAWVRDMAKEVLAVRGSLRGLVFIAASDTYPLLPKTVRGRPVIRACSCAELGTVWLVEEYRCSQRDCQQI